MYPSDEFTEVIDGVWVCDNCGAHADAIDKIVHFKTCRPGEEKKWEKFYAQAEEEAEDDKPFRGAYKKRP